MHVVFGAYDGPIDAKPDEKVIFIGDCVQYHGKIGDQLVQLHSKYEDRSRKDPYFAKHEDITLKMRKVTKKLKEHADDQVIRFDGCPVSVAEHVLFLVELGSTNNPYLNKETAWQYTRNYLMWKSATAAKRLRGQAYQKSGHCHRGDARPEVQRPDAPAAE
jgi:hypothetical protein